MTPGSMMIFDFLSNLMQTQLGYQDNMQYCFFFVIF